MLLVNLAEPDWVQVDCDAKILPNVLCVSDQVKVSNNNNHTITNQVDSKWNCPKSAIIKSHLCYIFLWFDGKVDISMKQSCKALNGNSVHLTNITIFSIFI